MEAEYSIKQESRKMALAISTKSKNFAPVSEGIHNLVLARILDIGTVQDPMY